MDWQKVFDSDSQSFYFWNVATNETSWTDPTKSSALSKLNLLELAKMQSSEKEDFVNSKDSDKKTANLKDNNAKKTANLNDNSKGDDGVNANANQNLQEPQPSEVIKNTTDTAASSEDYYKSKEYHDWYMQNMNNLQIANPSSSIPQTTFQVDDALSRREQIDAAFKHMSEMNARHIAASQSIPSITASDKLRSGGIDYANSMRNLNRFFDVEKFQRERAAEILSGSAKKDTQKLSKKQIQQFKKKKHDKKVRALLD